MLKMVRCAIVLALLCIVALSAYAVPLPESRKVIIDTDPGTDDALAILLALNSLELDVKAITVVPGNVTAAQGLENALQVVSLAGRCDVPVAGGAQHPLDQKLVTAEFFHGQNGLANLELPPAKCRADSRFAPDLIIELVHKYPRQITLVPVGPLTNIALAVSKDPSLAGLVKEVLLMGGSISGGNVTAAAEANIHNDPEAAQIVFNAGWPLTMVGLDVTEKTLFTRAHLHRLGQSRGLQNDFAVGLLRFMVGVSEGLGAAGTPMHDPLAVGAVVDRGFVATQDMRVDVETRGEFTRGETVASRHNSMDRKVLRGDRFVIDGIERVEPNVHVCVGVDAERFLELFLTRLTGR